MSSQTEQGPQYGRILSRIDRVQTEIPPTPEAIQTDMAGRQNGEADVQVGWAEAKQVPSLMGRLLSGAEHTPSM
jgi:hypothetical protein